MADFQLSPSASAGETTVTPLTPAARQYLVDCIDPAAVSFQVDTKMVSVWCMSVLQRFGLTAETL